MKLKPCAFCLRPFAPARPMQAVCSPACAGRKVRADKKREREQVRERKEAIKTIPQLKRDAQCEFNSYIRTRDRLAGFRCVSCCSNLDWSGNSVDAGHYRSVGSASHLRFNEDNCHAQCKQCNRYGAGRAVDYRIGLIERIGIEAVEALEADNRIHRWTREELRAIRATYREKLRALSAALPEETHESSRNA